MIHYLTTFKLSVRDTVYLDGVLDYWTVVSLLIVSLAALSPLVALLYQLMGFHAMLGTLFPLILLIFVTYTYLYNNNPVKRGITTYDYIVSEQKRLRDKKRIAAAAKSPSQESEVRLPAKESVGSSSAISKEVEIAKYSKVNQVRIELVIYPGIFFFL